MNNRKFFAFDLDGTLLNSDQQLSKDNIKALEAAREKGHVLVMATGRNYIYSQLSLKQHWGLFDYFIGCNGAIIHSIHQRDLISKDNKIDYDFILKIIDEVKDIGGIVQISTEWNVFTDLFIDEEIQIMTKINKERLIDPFPSIALMSNEDKKSIVQISVHFEEHNVRKIWAKWLDKYGENYEFAITSPRNIDINLKGINKLSAIKEIVKLEEIKFDNVFVFGDSQNDIKGLEYYNNTYAMENALKETKKAAKNIIGDNNSNAIAKVVLKNI